MLDQLRCLFASRLAHRLDNAGLGHAAEIVVDRRRPAGRHHVEADGLRDAVGVGERSRPPIPGLAHRVDAERDAMGEQRMAAVGVESEQSVPEVGGLLRQLRRPTPCRASMAFATAVSLRPGAWLPNTTLLTSISRQVSAV